jgi:glycosyltransferase involved in cell wall biosynthesis
MRIAFYNPTHLTFSSGPEIWLRNMLPLLKQGGHEVSLLMTSFQKCPDRIHLVTDLEDRGVRVAELAYISLAFSGSPLPIRFWRRKDGGLDYLYFFNGYAFQDVIGFIFAKRAGARAVYGVHAPVKTDYAMHNAYQRLVSLPLMNAAPVVHFLNRDDLRLMDSASGSSLVSGYGVAPEKIVQTIPKTRMHSQKLKVIFIGRLGAQKNIPRLLEVIEAAAAEDDIEFYIGGDGEFANCVKAAAGRLANLTYLGFIPNEHVAAELADKHVFLNLSLYETFGMAVLEALASGLPVVATRTQGIVSDYPHLMYKTVPLHFEVSDCLQPIRDLRRMLKNAPAAYHDLASSSAAAVRHMTWPNRARELSEHLQRLAA